MAEPAAHAAARPWAVVVPRGYRVGDWEVTDPIASGSWGGVYAARPVAPQAGEAVALKFLSTAGLSPQQRAGVRQSVEAEAAFSRRAAHPRLIRAIATAVVADPDAPALDGAVVIAMELARRSLRDVLDAAVAEEPVPDAQRLLEEICEGLVYLHGSGWVHGDLKPGNVLVMADGSVRLADFGLAAELEGTHAYVPQLGSSDFLPPEWWNERVSDRGVASRTTRDVWALGVTAHQLLTGGLHPFPGATARARAAAVRAYGAGRDPLRLAESLPQAWRSIVADCLAPDHQRRSRHPAGALLARMRAVSSPAASRRRRLWRAAATAGGVVAAVAVAGSLLIAPAAPVALAVYNAELACQSPRTPECALRLARTPYAAYRPPNVLGRVWHGDVLRADCLVEDGTLVRDEQLFASARWYRVVAPQRGWLPGVRVEPDRQPDLPRCREGR